jgi:hypothetical protein
VSLRYDLLPHFMARASPGLDEGKRAMGMVGKGMVERDLQHPAKMSVS